MSNEDNFDELIDRIQELSEDERSELIESFREDQLETYLDIRGRYIERMREEGLLGQFPEDSPWAEYCEKHPFDPICQRIMPQEEMRSHRRKLDRIRDDFIDDLREANLPYFDEGPAGLSPTIHRPPWWLCRRYPWLCPPDWHCHLFPWSWRCFCRRYPWLCRDLEIPENPIPDPGPYGPRFDDMISQYDPMATMSGAGFAGEGMSGGWAPSGEYPSEGFPAPEDMMQSYGEVPFGGMPQQYEAFPSPGFDICRLFPHLPQCRPQSACARYPWLPWCRRRPCPPICWHRPWLPFCRNCWGPW